MNVNKNIKLCAIVAMAENRAIGKNNALLWHIPEDLKHFKRTTMGQPMIMGRKSFESLPGILPGRPHIVISRSRNAHDGSKISQNNAHKLYCAGSIERAIEQAQTLVQRIQPEKTDGNHLDSQTETPEIFICGGGEIYRQTLAQIERLYLTIVHRVYDGDTYFPEIDWTQWATVSKEYHEGDPSFTIYVLDRKSAR